MKHFRLLAVLAGVLYLCCPVSADIIFTLLPPAGDVSGPPGSTVGWGYTLTNTDSSDWFESTNLNSDSFLHGTPTLLFDFPILGPASSATEPFDAAIGSGLFELQWEANAPTGFVNSGNFVLSGQLFDGDPLNGGSFIADATDIAVPYTATVSGGTSGVPEPSSLRLAAWGILLIVVCGLRRVRASLLTGRRTALIAMLALLPNLTSAAQNTTGAASESTNDARITRDQADEILNELRQIRQLLERQIKPVAPAPMLAPPQTGKLRLDGGSSLGSSSAPLVIVEFTDYQCPFCRQFQNTTLVEIRKKYIDTGKVRFVIRDFPLDGHQEAKPAAEAARCAGDQGKFWAMHDALFSDPSKLGLKGFVDYAESLKLDTPAFRSCLESDKHKPEILNDIQVASSLQINGTPSFLIGKAIGDEVSGAILIGAQPLSAFEAKLREAETH